MSANIETNQQDKIGLVVRKDPGKYTVALQGNRMICSVSGSLVRQIKSADLDGDPIVVGDQVRIRNTGDSSGVIDDVLSRRTKFSRRGTGERPYEQVIAANLDQVIAVLSVARPEPKWNLLDRYLVSASLSGLPAVICITKSDLLEPREGLPELDIYEKLGYLVIRTSSSARTGIDQVREILSNQFSVLIGKSGVGKTSLLNAVQSGLGLRVGAVGRESGKGRHTTTSLEMFDLDFGGRILDTPGMREFGLLDLEGEDLANHFPEIRPYIGKCRFGLSCLHGSEPGCKVTEAVSSGLISIRRYESYQKLAGEMACIR